MSGRRVAVLRGICKHRSYTIAEVARALGKCRATVGRWTKRGLPMLTDKKPHLISGADLIAFHAQRKAARPKCRLSECYCFHCRTVREAASGMAELVIDRPATGNLHALCGTCTGLMHKRVSLKNIDALRAVLDVTIRQAPSRISQ